MTRYSREDVLRILQLQGRELATWERAGLVPVQEQYGFHELCQLRTLSRLRSVPGPMVHRGGVAAAAPGRRISPAMIRRSLEAMQRVSGMRNALGEATAMRRGRKLAFRHGGALVDPLTQQLEFDFEAGRDELRIVGQERAKAIRAAEIQQMFLQAVQMEESGAAADEAAAVYERISTLR